MVEPVAVSTAKSSETARERGRTENRRFGKGLDGAVLYPDLIGNYQNMLETFLTMKA